MAAVVLMSKPESPYADTATSYEFPVQYLRWFEPLGRGEPMLAIIYEPYARGSGRQAFIGWASLTIPPTRSSRTTSAGRPLWQVIYDDRVHEFPVPVRRDAGGEPLEAWLREVPREDRDLRTSGRSVRPLEDGDLAAILQLGFSGAQDSATLYPDRANPTVETQVAERTRHLVATLERSARFREGVVQAYGFRCAITQFSTGVLPQGRVSALIDAAHIRPVADRGSDNLSNGVAMTPTVHRLFDAGLFTLRSAADGGLEVLVSAGLDHDMVESPDGSSRIRLTTGSRIALPADPRAWPSADQLAYHQRRVFHGALRSA